LAGQEKGKKKKKKKNFTEDAHPIPIPRCREMDNEVRSQEKRRGGALPRRVTLVNAYYEREKGKENEMVRPYLVE